MNRLEQIKDQVAQENGFASWNNLPFDVRYESRCDEISKRYAAECCKATLEKASALMYEYNKDSNPQEASDLIENPDNITLL